jgi:hypothetical protein
MAASNADASGTSTGVAGCGNAAWHLAHRAARPSVWYRRRLVAPHDGHVIRTP